MKSKPLIWFAGGQWYCCAKNNFAVGRGDTPRVAYLVWQLDSWPVNRDIGIALKAIGL